jgi:dephospho-CoA kinase
MVPDQVVVITGPIGSGKSFVADLFRQRGWQVIDADRLGHEVLQEPAVIESIAARWPSTVESGMVDRSRLAAVVFANNADLNELQTLTHSRIRGKIAHWLNGNSGPRLVEVSVPKAISSDWGSIIVLDASEPVRLARLLKRGSSREAALARMRSQPSRKAWLDLAHVVLNNESRGTAAPLCLIDYLNSA